MISLISWFLQSRGLLTMKNTSYYCFCWKGELSRSSMWNMLISASFFEKMADWPAYRLHDVGDPSLRVVGVGTGACFDGKVLMYGRVEFGQIFFTGNGEGQILECFHCCRDLWHIQNFGLRLRRVLVIMGLNSTAVQKKNAFHSKYKNECVIKLHKKTRHPWMEMFCALCVAI